MVFNINSNKKLIHNKSSNFSVNIFQAITFDLSLNFKDHILDFRKKCIYRLNFIKLLSNKSYKLTKQTPKTLFISLVRSIIDYSSLIIPCNSKTLGQLIQATQNTSFGIIHRLKFDTNTE